MEGTSLDAHVLPAKDGEQHPIPTAWRPVFRQVVDVLVIGDYELRSCQPFVRVAAPDVPAQMQDYIAEYGATLVALPQEAWSSSVCIWYGSHWDVLIDLWTIEEGRSDLVLKARVFDSPPGITVQVDMVYVP